MGLQGDCLQLQVQAGRLEQRLRLVQGLHRIIWLPSLQQKGGYVASPGWSNESAASFWLGNCMNRPQQPYIRPSKALKPFSRLAAGMQACTRWLVSPPSQHSPLAQCACRPDPYLRRLQHLDLLPKRPCSQLNQQQRKTAQRVPQPPWPL